MKMLRNILRVVAAGTMIFLASCADEDDPTGTGDDRAKFNGSWTCNETSQQQGSSTYTITVTNDATSADKIVVKNFYNLGTSTNTFIVIDGNNMTIQAQQVSGNTLSGTGTYSNGAFTVNFSADDGQNVDQVTANAHH
jgi:hypothetical protein